MLRRTGHRPSTSNVYLIVITKYGSGQTRKPYPDKRHRSCGRHSCGQGIQLENSGQHPTILIVEDIEWIRSAMKKAVELEGYRAVEATNDTEAFEFAELELIELILTEEELPTFNALIARLREHATLNNVPVVFVNFVVDEGARHRDAYLLANYADITPLLAVLRH